MVSCNGGQYPRRISVEDGHIAPYTREAAANNTREALERIVDALRDTVSAALPAQQRDAQRVMVLAAIAALDSAINDIKAFDMAETNWLKYDADAMAL